jgi:hypothetical protein
VTEVLELAQFLEDDGVAEVDVGGGGVEPELDAERPAFGEPTLERPARQAVDRIPDEVGGLVGRGFCHPAQC